MKDKYYTPNIEEFHIGFRYEGLYKQKWTKLVKPPADLPMEWFKCMLDTSHSISKIIYDIKGERIRVKYLDNADIQELGWKLISEEVKPYSHWCRFKYKKLWELTVQLNDKYISRTLNIRSISTNAKGNIRLKCKNYNELKKIMQMLNIEI